MSILQSLYLNIDKNHSSEPCLNTSEIDLFESIHHYIFPEDLKDFYRRYKSVRLFDDEHGATYRFVPISEIHPTRTDIYGEDTEEFGPDSWLTICDVLEGNYIAIDIDSKEGEEYNFIDCFHETFAQLGECTIIAKTFTELLERALSGGGNNVYYLQQGFTGYGDGRPLTPENTSLRIDNPEAPRKGWLVNFTFKGIPHNKFFIDDEFGGKDLSFEAVKRHIEETIR